MGIDAKSLSNDMTTDQKDLGYDNVVPVLEGAGSEDANAFLAAHGGAQTYDEAARKKLVRKIDMHLMPLMCITYCLQVSFGAVTSLSLAVRRSLTIVRR